MKVYVSQVYIEVGVDFPFTVHFQRWLSEKLSERVHSTEHFERNYPGGYTLIFRLSAKQAINQPEVRGPTRFKREKDLEFTIFLPFKKTDFSQVSNRREVLVQFFDSMTVILESLFLDHSDLINSLPELVDELAANPRMISLDCL